MDWTAQVVQSVFPLLTSHVFPVMIILSEMLLVKGGVLKKPILFFYVFRPAPILLVLSSLCLIVLSATRTWAVISAQAGPVVATLAVIGLEGSLTGGLLAVSRSRQEGWLPQLLRHASTVLSVVVLVLVLVVTNTYSEIRSLGVIVNQVVMDWLVVVFLGAIVPLLVVVNIENMTSRVSQYLADYQRDLADWLMNQAGSAYPRSPSGALGATGSSNGNNGRRRVSRAKRLEALRALNDGELADLAGLSRMFGVSPSTIRRDVQSILEEREGF